MLASYYAFWLVLSLPLIALAACTRSKAADIPEMKCEPMVLGDSTL